MCVRKELRYLTVCNWGLVQAQWAPATRVTYHRWTLLCMRFAATFGRQILPVDCEVACRWPHVLCSKFAGKTVNVAISSIVALSALNNLQNPVLLYPRLRMAWRAVNGYAADRP
jgi:hypothetical protein